MIPRQELDLALSSLGFKHKGDFEPIEVDADDFDNICEIGSWFVAIQKEYIALFNYTEMVYWDVASDSMETTLKAIEAISKYEIQRHVQMHKEFAS